MLETKSTTRFLFWTFDGALNKREQANWLAKVEKIKERYTHKSASFISDGFITSVDDSGLNRTRRPTMTLIGELENCLCDHVSAIIIVPNATIELPGYGTALEIAKKCEAEGFIFTADQALKGRKKKKTVKVAEAPPVDVSTRLKRGRFKGAKNGYHQSGPAPYGYMRKRERKSPDENRTRRVIVPHPEESKIVQLIFREYLRLGSLAKLINALADRGIRTRRGKPWSRAGLSWIIKNETYLGMVGFGEIHTRGKHEAIISRIVFNKANKRMSRNNKRGSKDKSKAQA